jgi:hypothetical protein
VKRFIFYAMDQYTLKVYRRKEWEAGVQHGIKCEQQRIIKLLETEMKRLEEWTDYPAVNALMNIRAALIKGEK